MKKLGNNSNSPRLWRVVYHQSVVAKDIPNLDHVVAKRIRRAIEQKLLVDPTLYAIPLRGTLHQLWKLRVSDWRIVFSIIKSEIRILIIAHRREVYKKTEKRI